MMMKTRVPIEALISLHSCSLYYFIWGISEALVWTHLNDLFEDCYLRTE
jgi:hypothetical protein